MTTAQVAFALVLLATGLMRLVELGVSVRRMRERPGDVVDEPRLFPFMALLHAGLVLLPIAEVLWLDRPFRVGWAATAGAVLVLATALRVWTLRTIGWAWNVRVVQPPEDAVVTSGPYRYIRHPNYVCVIAEIAALPLLHGAWCSALALSVWNAGVLFVRIRTEEDMLMKIPAWRQAFADRARLIPGVF